MRKSLPRLSAYGTVFARHADVGAVLVLVAQRAHSDAVRVLVPLFCRVGRVERRRGRGWGVFRVFRVLHEAAQRGLARDVLERFRPHIAVQTGTPSDCIKVRDRIYCLKRGARQIMCSKTIDTTSKRKAAVALALMVLIAWVEHAGDPPFRHGVAWQAAASEQHALALERLREIKEFALQHARFSGADCFAVVGWVAALGAATVF